MGWSTRQPLAAPIAIVTHMADRSRLVPALITDRRGRRTTVYRNPEGGGRAPLQAAPPPPPAPRGVIPDAPMRTRAELREFERRTAKYLRENGDDHYRLDLRRWERNRESAAAASLAIEMAENGSLPEIDAVFVVADAMGDELGDFAHDSLRVAARLAGRIAADPADWTSAVVIAMAGLRRSRPDGPRLIVSEQDLTEASAVVEFLLAAPGACVTERLTVPHARLATWVENPHLEALLRERPDDANRIAAYVSERGIHPSDKEPVDALGEWLDSPARALAEGWL